MANNAVCNKINITTTIVVFHMITTSGEIFYKHLYQGTPLKSMNEKKKPQKNRLTNKIIDATFLCKLIKRFSYIHSKISIGTSRNEYYS